MTGSMERAIDETNRRREKQEAFNKANGITPQALNKKVRDIMDDSGGSQFDRKAGKGPQKKVAEPTSPYESMSPAQLAKEIEKLEAKMMAHAKNLEFEDAAATRDQIHQLRELGFMR